MTPGHHVLTGGGPGFQMQLKVMALPPAPCCQLDADVAEVRRTMAAYASNHVLALDSQRRLRGRLYLEDLPACGKQPIISCLRMPAFWLRDDATALELVQLMHYQRLRQVPVSDEHDAIYGAAGWEQLRFIGMVVDSAAPDRQCGELGVLATCSNGAVAPF